MTSVPGISVLGALILDGLILDGLTLGGIVLCNLRLLVGVTSSLLEVGACCLRGVPLPLVLNRCFC